MGEWRGTTPDRFPILPSPRARFNRSAPVSFFFSTRTRLRDKRQVDNPALQRSSGPASPSRGQNPHTNTHFASRCLRGGAPLRSEPSSSSSSARSVENVLLASASRAEGAARPDMARLLPWSHLLCLSLRALIALVSLPCSLQCVWFYALSWHRPTVMATLAPIWRSLTAFALWFQDGGDAPLEDQPQTARQARHHQNLVGKLVPGIRVPHGFDCYFCVFFICFCWLLFVCFTFSEEILNPSVPMALRLSGILMGEFDFACATENCSSHFLDSFFYVPISMVENSKCVSRWRGDRVREEGEASLQ